MAFNDNSVTSNSADTARLLSALGARMTSLSNEVGRELFIGVQSGATDAFVLNNDQRNDILAREPSATVLIRSLLGAANIRPWQVKPSSKWLLYIPWHFPLTDAAHLTQADPQAEVAFEQQYPWVYKHLLRYKPQLLKRYERETGKRYEWFCVTRPRPEAAPYFNSPKIVFPVLARSPSFAWDLDSNVIDNTAYFIPNRKWLLAVLNSPVVSWFLRKTSALRKSDLHLTIRNLKEVPIPLAIQEQKQVCEWFIDAITWLHQPHIHARASTLVTGPLSDYLQQWLNGLIYELFFPAHLHRDRLLLFNETAKLSLPRLTDLSDERRLIELATLFHRVYDIQAPLRSMLFSLASTEPLRVFEGTQ